MDKRTKQILDFQTRLQGLANAVGEQIVDALNATDSNLLKTLQKELRGIRSMLIKETAKPEEVFKRLQSLETKIIEIRAKGLKNALKIVKGEAGNLLDLTTRQAGKELEESVKVALENEKEIRKSTIKSELTEEQIKTIIDYQPFDGRSINKWLEGYLRSDVDRIFQTVQKGVVDGTSLAGIMKQIQGTADEPGILETERQQARTIGRTIINGVANHGRMEIYRENADVIDGIKWLATLDSRACPVCGSLDGTVWKNDQLDQVKSPPAHPNCRCVLVPWIDLGKEFEFERPVEAANFDKLAEEEYNKNPKRKKEWKQLSYDTRKQKRYEAIKKWSKETGKDPYQRIEGATFKDYLEQSTPEFRYQYLGPRRAAAYEAGTLPLEKMGDPDSGYKKTLSDLEKEGLIPPKPVKEKQARNIARVGDNLETKSSIESAQDVEKYLRYAKTDEIRNIEDRLRYLDNDYNIKLEGGEIKGNLDKIKAEQKRLQRKLGELEKQEIHKFFAPTSGETVKKFEQKVDKDLKGKNRMGKPYSDEYVRKPIKEGGGFVARIIDSHGIEINQSIPDMVLVKADDRSSYEAKTNIIRLANRAGVDVSVAHEMGHFMEDNNPIIQKRCQEFYDNITKDGEKRSLKEDFPKGKYDDDEFYIKTVTPMPSYATKCMNEGTELFSKGMEMLFDDPIKFSRKYPEFFNFIILTLQEASTK